MHPTEIEKRRKFLVELPLTWYAKFKLHKSRYVRMHSSFLNEPIYPISTLDSEVEYYNSVAKVKYTHNVRDYVSPGVYKTLSTPITQSEYSEKMKKYARYSKHKISRVRYKIIFIDRMFDLDVFEDRLEGLSILSAPVADMLDKIVLPPHFRTNYEITTDYRYQDINLAEIDSYEGCKSYRFARKIEK